MSYTLCRKKKGNLLLINKTFQTVSQE